MSLPNKSARDVDLGEVHQILAGKDPLTVHRLSICWEIGRLVGLYTYHSEKYEFVSWDY